MDSDQKFWKEKILNQKDDPRNIFFNQRMQYDDTAKNQSKANSTDSSDNYQQKLDEMKKLAAKYQREGEGQLVKDILNNVLEQKAAGNLTNEQLLQFANRISPLLNAEQKSRLDELVQQLLKL